MRRVTSSAGVGLAALGVAVLAPAGTAVADPKGGDAFRLTCANGATYSVVAPPANGSFTPAFDTASNTVLVPVVFGAFTGTAYDEAGEVVASFTDDETQVKGSGKQRGLTSCAYRFEDTVTLTAEEAEAEELPGAGTYTFVGTGTVLAQIRGR